MEKNSFSFFWGKNKVLVILLFCAIAFNGVNFWITLLCFAFIFAFYSKKISHLGLGLIALLAICYIIYFGNARYTVNLHNALWNTVLPFSALFVGKIMGRVSKTENDIVYWLFIISTSLMIQNVPITMYDIFVNGLVNPERDLMVLSDEDTQRAVTGRAIDLCLSLASFCTVYFYKTSYYKICKWFTYFSIVSLLCAMHYVSRSAIVFALVGIIMGLLFSQKSLRTMLRMALLYLFLFFVLTRIGLISVYSDRMDDPEGLSTLGNRTLRWAMGVDLLSKYPNGYAGEHQFAHNFWLDFGIEGGTIPALLLFVFSVCCLVLTLRFSLANKQLSPFIRCLFLSFMTCGLLGAFTEPIHEGAPAFTMSYFMLCGILLERPEKRLVPMCS